ncbi:hypothetical protein [Methanococcoides alaskense]|uniref:Uncharacterized protein n=1 Tax=Methanococcoides alaskense TaxID=325778 RepID=A0AA90U0S0_9EURY|nr:hypothetical protein [Methanococcoides alaskense]MDA0524161.1 hypothetical protein [Methanococcoides alaskense]MDR6223848.1 hypothetical protein [Methanococcoides alaskense]
MMHYYDTFNNSYVFGFLLEIILILVVVGAAIVFLSRSGLVGSQNSNERLVSMEKDVADIKKTVEEIRDKLEEI